MDRLGARDRLDFLLASRLAGRRVLALGGMAGGSAVAAAATPSSVRLVLNRGVENRALATDFPQKKTMIVQRNRPPLLETPMAVFDRGVFTPMTNSTCAGTGTISRWRWTQLPFAWKSWARWVGRFRSASTNCCACRACPTPPSTNVRAIPAPFSSRACPVRNGRMARWAMLVGGRQPARGA